MENGERQCLLFMFERVRAESISNVKRMLSFSSACWCSHAVRKFLQCCFLSLLMKN